MNNSPNKSAKSVLSRLLASENIFVVHSNTAKTASFDIKNRVLTLPVFKDMSNEQYDMFIGHEVSHAIFTPFTGEDQKCLTDHKCLSSAYTIADGDKNFFGLAHSYMNIVEDARIERLIKDKFNGLRRDFYVGYRELFDKNFFDTNGKNIAEYSLIDRINLHFKVGFHINVPFSAEEMEFVKMVESTLTFDDVVDVAKKIWNYSKSKNEDQMSDSTMVDIFGENGEDTDGENAPAKDKDGKVSNGKNWSSRSVSPDASMTQKAFDKNFSRLIDEHSYNHSYYALPTFNMKESVVSYKELMAMYDDCANRYAPNYLRLQTEADKFVEDSNRVVNILAQAFFAKKAAKDHQRSMTHRTGVIDTVRMMDYKFNDDIFRRMKVVKKGKSHGLVFFMDLSGSMSPILEDTFKQLIQLVLFCKRVNIPFEVYGFSTKLKNGYEFDYGDSEYVDQYNTAYANSWIEPKFNYGKDTTEKTVCPFTLINLFSSKMTKREISTMIRNLFAMCDRFRRGGGAFEVPRIMDLSSTPLIETIVAAMDIIPMFKAQYKLDIVHSVFLTDGQPTGVYMNSNNSHYTKNQFTFDSTKDGLQNDLISMFREYTGSKAIQFFLCDAKTKLPLYEFDSTGYNYNYSYTDDSVEGYTEANTQYVKEGWAVAKSGSTRYNEKFIIRASNSVDNEDLEEALSQRTSNVGIRNAFVKAMNSTMTSRVMLNRFIDLIATE